MVHSFKDIQLCCHRFIVIHIAVLLYHLDGYVAARALVTSLVHSGGRTLAKHLAELVTRLHQRLRYLLVQSNVTEVQLSEELLRWQWKGCF